MCSKVGEWIRVYALKFAKCPDQPSDSKCPAAVAMNQSTAQKVRKAALGNLRSVVLLHKMLKVDPMLAADIASGAFGAQNIPR